MAEKSTEKAVDKAEAKEPMVEKEKKVEKKDDKSNKSKDMQKAVVTKHKAERLAAHKAKIAKDAKDAIVSESEDKNGNKVQVMKVNGELVSYTTLKNGNVKQSKLRTS